MSRFERVGSFEWPYPIRYGEEKEVDTDVLVVGGGIAGCHAAIMAHKKGAKVVVVEKAATITSGSGGAGVDHWGCVSNPCSKITPEEAMKRRETAKGPKYNCGHITYIDMKENWEALLDVEKWGVKIRDVDDEFVGAEFRDEKTKLIFAYDYDNKTTLAIQAGHIKPAMYKELKRLGVPIYDRVMVTRLLTEEGKQGTKVVGATGVNVRNGEFYVFKAKATILCTGQPLKIWVFSTELAGSNSAHDDPNCAGDALAMAWEVGAEALLMEYSVMRTSGGFRYPAYATGNPNNTWYPCTMVDANGKEIPWVNTYTGKVLKTVTERSHPAPGQLLGRPARLIPDLPERIKKGEFVLPLYADLPSMPKHERRRIFGLMFGNEGKTRYVYKLYTEYGFDPDKDMLQANVLPPEHATRAWGGMSVPYWRSTWTQANGGGLMADWDLKTNIEGLYLGGNTIAGAGDPHPRAASTGRYAARIATKYALKAGEPVIDRKQVEDEKARVYAPVNREDGMGWKELQAGICRVMQDYCGEYKSDSTLKMGLWYLNSIRESDVRRAYARNPHELMRIIECFVRLTVGEIIFHSCLVRKASSESLNFKRLDYPEIDPPEWNKFLPIRLENGEVKVREVPLKYWLLPTYAPTYKENYDQHCAR